MIIDLFAGCNTLHNKDNNLIQETRRVITELNNAQLLFNEITDPYEIESLIYRMKQLELHYSFLIKEAKLCRIASIEHTGDKTL